MGGRTRLLHDGIMTTTNVLQRPGATIGTAPPAMVEARSLTRVWGKGAAAHTAVDRVDLTLPVGELTAIVGPSGSGKSTLGAMIAGIDRPTAGSIVAAGGRLDQLDTDALARWRAEHVGIVFQNFHLIPTLSAAENVALGLRFGARMKSKQRSEQVREALAAVGLADKAKRLPSQLSGGEQQRVGLARAVVHRPPLVVADEPTGALDTVSGQLVFDLIRRLRDAGTTVVFITHDAALAVECDRTITMVDGKIESAAT